MGNVGGALGFRETGSARAIEELKQVCYVPKETRRLSTAVDRAKAVLKDADQQQISSHEVRLWLWELKQLFLDGEDLLDELATDSAVQSMGVPTCNIPTMAPARRDQVRDTTDRLDHHLKIPMLNLQVSTVNHSHLTWLRRRQTSSLLPDKRSVTGRDREKEEIIKMLLSPPQVAESSGNSSFSVLPIVGMGGMGKTTLARLVFNDPRVMEHFDLMMWLCVSNDFDPERLTKEMIDAAFAFKGKNEQYQSTNWDSMQRKLLQEVEGKTFLLVLDDVWEAEQSKWEELFKPLHFGKKGSKILVTSRNRSFVNKIPGRMDPLPLGGLSDADIWSLLQRYAFHGVTYTNGTGLQLGFLLQAIGRGIVPRLKGSPLAARTIGSLLNSELDARHWETVMKSELWMLPQGEDDILPALQLSYRCLHGDLRPCFAYCSLFPKGYMFDKEGVVRLWEAQCFITTERGTRLMEIMTGSKCFDELLHRSFFSLETCCYVMHDLTHDLAEFVSRDDCFRLEDRKPRENIPDTVRHISVCVSKSDQGMLYRFCRYEKLRTLLFLRWCAFDELSTHAFDELFSKLKLLRVLGLRGCGITELPSSIGDLKHLRYLDLSWNGHLGSLPESLGRLYNLQVLNLEDCHLLRALPATMSMLINLRHLQAARELASSIDGLGKLTGLRELQVRGTRVMEVGGMRMLRRLTVWKLEEVGNKDEVMRARVHCMEHLQALRLEWRDVDKDFVSEPGAGMRDPEFINPEVEEEVLQTLRPGDGVRELYIRGYGGVRTPGWMQHPILDSSSLRRVLLEGCPNWRVLPSSIGQLRHLESLMIRSMPRWEKWMLPGWDGVHHPNARRNPHTPSLPFFPFLCELEILKCPEFKGDLPLLPTTLKRLRLEDVGLSRLPGLRGFRRGGRGIKMTPSSHSPSVSSALSTLHIRSCHHLTSIGQLLQQHLPDLEEILIDDCKELASLPESGFGHLVSLQKLLITDCPNLTCPVLARGENQKNAPSQPLPCSLRKLRIERCGDATGGWWWDGLHRLTSLSQLSLHGCPATAASLFVSLGRHHPHHLTVTLKELAIKECGCEYQQEYHTISTLSSVPPPLAHPPNPPPADASSGGIRSLTSLTDLTILGSPGLLRKWGGGGLPSSLRGLTIGGGDHFDDGFLSATHLQDLASLKTLTIDGDDGLDDESLSAFLLRGCTSSLKNLALKNLRNLRSLPDTLSCLSSLQCLELGGCPSIQSLPARGVLPASLGTLKIYGCPTLTEGRKFQDKSMWPEISHIPIVEIDLVELDRRN